MTTIRCEVSGTTPEPGGYGYYDGGFHWCSCGAIVEWQVPQLSDFDRYPSTAAVIAAGRAVVAEHRRPPTSGEVIDLMLGNAPAAFFEERLRQQAGLRAALDRIAGGSR